MVYPNAGNLSSSPDNIFSSFGWFLTHKAWNQLMHSLHGNTTPLITRINTAGLPTLPVSADSAEKFINFKIDMQSWCAVNGTTPYIIGPAPANPDAGLLSEGLRYLCNAIQSPHLRSAIAIYSQGNGPRGWAYLQSKFLRGAAEQPIIQAMLDRLSLRENESIVEFESEFTKLSGYLNPRESDYTLSTKFCTAITRETRGFYESCIDGAMASQDMNDFDTFVGALIKLCSARQARNANRNKSEEQALYSERSDRSYRPTNHGYRKPNNHSKVRNRDRNVPTWEEDQRRHQRHEPAENNDTTSEVGNTVAIFSGTRYEDTEDDGYSHSRFIEIIYDKPEQELAHTKHELEETKVSMATSSSALRAVTPTFSVFTKGGYVNPSAPFITSTSSVSARYKDIQDQNGDHAYRQSVEIEYYSPKHELKRANEKLDQAKDELNEANKALHEAEEKLEQSEHRLHEANTATQTIANELELIHESDRATYDDNMMDSYPWDESSEADSEDVTPHCQENQPGVPSTELRITDNAPASMAGVVQNQGCIIPTNKNRKCDEKEDGYKMEPPFELYRKPFFSPGPLLSFAIESRSTPVHGQIGLYATAGIPLYGAHNHKKKRAHQWADQVPAHHKEQKKPP